MWAMLHEQETQFLAISCNEWDILEFKQNLSDTLFCILKVSYSRNLEYKPVSKINTIVKVFI